MEGDIAVLAGDTDGTRSFEGSLQLCNLCPPCTLSFFPLDNVRFVGLYFGNSLEEEVERRAVVAGLPILDIELHHRCSFEWRAC